MLFKIILITPESLLSYLGIEYSDTIVKSIHRFLKLNDYNYKARDILQSCSHCLKNLFVGLNGSILRFARNNRGGTLVYVFA